jgi:sortase B
VILLRKKPSIFQKLLLAVIIILLLICIGVLVVYLVLLKKGNDVSVELKSQIISKSDSGNTGDKDDSNRGYPYIQDKFKKILEENGDFIGWLSIEDTTIDYPVMQTKDDEQFYLHRDFNKNYNFAGTLFAQANCNIVNGDNIVIYGHNMITETMFHDLRNFTDEDFAKTHNITFNTLYEDGEYEVIAVLKDKIYSSSYTGVVYYDFVNILSQEEFDKYMDYFMETSIFDLKRTGEYGDKYIMLSTCAYHTTNGRLVVIGKKIG